MALENEIGIPDNPLKMSWLETSAAPTDFTYEAPVLSSAVDPAGETFQSMVN